MNKSRLLIVTLALLLFLPGCTRHYRQSLNDFNRGEKSSSFYQRSLDWTRRAEGASVSSASLAMAMAPTLTALGAAARAEEPFDALAAQLLGIDRKTFDARRAALDTPAKLDRAFAVRLRWADFQVAVAVDNPEVKAARADWRATLRQYEQADYLEGLLGQFRSFTRTLNVETGEPLNRPMAQAFFPFPAAMSWKGEMIRQMARMAELDWQKMLRDNLVMAGEKFFEYQYLDRAQGAARDNVRLLEEFVKVTEERYRTGLVQQPSLLRVQNDLATQRNALLDLESRARTARAQLNALAGRSPEAALGPAAPENLKVPNVSYETLAALAEAGRQEVLAQRAAIARTEAAIRMSEVMNRPAASAGASTFERGMMSESSAGAAPMASGAATGMGGGAGGAGGAATESAGPTFGEKAPAIAPRYGFAQTEAYLAETRQRLEGDRQRLENLRLQARSLARAAVEDLGTARRKAELLEHTTLPQNQSIYNLSLSDYTSGNTTFVELQDAERELINTRLMVHEAQRDLSQAVVRLATVAGRMINAE